MPCSVGRQRRHSERGGPRIPPQQNVRFPGGLQAEAHRRQNPHMCALDADPCTALGRSTHDQAPRNLLLLQLDQAG